MAIESATTIAGLNPAWPLGIDLKSEGDNHIRLIKQVLQNEFPTGAAGVVKPTAQTRNRIVNGAMQISQENGYTASSASSALSFYAVDQFVAVSSTSPGTATAQWVQAGTTPNGSKNRFRIVVGTAKAALAAGDFIGIQTMLEGIRVADFRWGSASAKQVIVRFGFKGPAGTYSVSLTNGVAVNRTYIATFTITAGQANTDTAQTFVIPGDTVGVWPNDASRGMYMGFWVAAGTTYQGVAGWNAGNLMGTAANTNGMATAGNVFELFDVGLYLDPLNTGIPPAWEMPDEAQELAACQRYWEPLSGINVWGYQLAGGGLMAAVPFKVTKRVIPATAILSWAAASNAGTQAIYNTTSLGCSFGINASAAGTAFFQGLTATANSRM